MTNSTFPISYKDPVYAAADQAASDAAGIPPGLLPSIRLAGEKSNANQVSSAGAQSVYQFTPTTRQLIIKKYGIDPLSSPEAAALGAAYLLKEGIQRTGSAAGAVTQYIGGTDPTNWGGQTRAYTNRVMAHFTKNGGQDTPQPDPVTQPAAPLPSAASYGLDPSVVGLGGSNQAATAPVQITSPQAAAPGANVNQQIIADYNAGRLSPEDMADVQKRAPALGIDPSQLQAPAQEAPAPQPAQPKQIGPQTLAALQAGTLTPDQQATIKAGIANGTLVMPQQAQQAAIQPQSDATGPSNDGFFAAGLPASAAPANQNPTTAAQNGSTLSDVAEKAVGGVAGSLLDIASAGGRLVGATDFANGAQQAHQQIDAKIAKDTNNSTAGKVAGVVGSAVPYATMGGASLAGSAAGGAMAGAVPAIASDKSIGETARDAAFGAGAGAAGFGAGKALGSVVGSIAENPTVAKAIAKAKSIFGAAPSEGNKVAQAGGVRDAQDAADIANASGQTPAQLATKLESAPAPQTPGYTPTAAEMAQDANVTTVQKANTNAQPAVAANASADNDAAIARYLDQRSTANAAPAEALNPGTPANPQAAEQAAEQAAQKSDVLSTIGQTEVQPLSNKVAETLQSPQFEAPVKLAKKMAADTGSTVFEDHAAAKQAAAADTLQQIIGTPEQLEALKSARGAQAADDFLSTHIGVPVDSPEMQSLFQKPAIKKAIAQAETTAQNQGESSIFTTTQNRSNANVGGAKAAPQKYVSGRGLVNAKAALDDQISAAARAGENSQVRTLNGVKQHLLDVLDTAIPDYGKARANFAEASGPIDAMQAVQSRLYSAVDPVTKEMDPGKLVSAINSIKTEQMKPGFRAADKVPPETIDALTALAKHLQNKNDLTGLSGEGQEYIRQALAKNPEKFASAHEQFKSVLSEQSPAYEALHGVHAQTVSAIDSAKVSQTALAQAQNAVLNADSPQGLKAIDKLMPDMEAADRAKAVALRQQKAMDLAKDVIDSADSPAGLRALDKFLPNMSKADQANAIALRQAKARDLAMSRVEAFNKNSRGATEYNRNTFRHTADDYTPYMAPNDAAQFGNVAQDLHNQTTAYAKTGKISGSDTAQNQNVGKRLAGNIGDAIKDRAVQAMVGGSIGSAAGLGGAGLGAAVGVIAPAIVKTITQKVSNITGENAAKLLSNGKLLAAALRNYESLAARRLFIQQLSSKVGYTAGATVGNQVTQRR